MWNNFDDVVGFGIVLNDGVNDCDTMFLFVCESEEASVITRSLTAAFTVACVLVNDFSAPATVSAIFGDSGHHPNSALLGHSRLPCGGTGYLFAQPGTQHSCTPRGHRPPANACEHPCILKE